MTAAYIYRLTFSLTHRQSYYSGYKDHVPFLFCTPMLVRPEKPAVIRLYVFGSLQKTGRSS